MRPIAPFLAGSSRMPLRRFLPYDIVAAGAWSTTFVLIGYVFWHSFDQVVVVAKKGAFGLGAVAAVLVGAMVVYRQLREPENRARVQAWLDQRWIYRVALAPVGRVLSGPARFAWNRLTPGNLGLELTTLLAVAAVGSFAFVGYAIVLHGVDFTPGDLRVLRWSRDLHTTAIADAAKIVTWLGSLSVVGPLAGLTAVWLVARRRLLEASVLVSGTLLTVVAVHVAKNLSNRPRPLGELVDTAGSSWPSAHAAYAVALVAIAVAVARSMGAARTVALVTAAIVAAALVGASRVYLRAHFLSDVLSGYGLAATIFSLCAICALVIDFVRHNVKTTS